MNLKESSTYRMILAEGFAQGKLEARKDTVVRIDTKRFGPPHAATLAVIQSVNDLNQANRLLDRLLDAADWQDLLAALACCPAPVFSPLKPESSLL